MPLISSGNIRFVDKLHHTCLTSTVGEECAQSSFPKYNAIVLSPSYSYIEFYLWKYFATLSHYGVTIIPITSMTTSYNLIIRILEVLVWCVVLKYVSLTYSTCSLTLCHVTRAITIYTNQTPHISFNMFTLQPSTMNDCKHTQAYPNVVGFRFHQHEQIHEGLLNPTIATS